MWRVTLTCENGHHGFLAFDELGYLRDPGACEQCAEAAVVILSQRAQNREVRKARRKLKRFRVE
jgi:hypothetical protein